MTMAECQPWLTRKSVRGDWHAADALVEIGCSAQP